MTDASITIQSPVTVQSPAVVIARRYARGCMIVAVLIPASWHVCYDLTMTITGWPQYRWPALVAFSWIGYLVIGAVGALTVYERIDRRRFFWPLVGAALTIVVAVLAACRPVDILGSINWGWGAIGWLGVILCWHRPLSHLVALLGANGAVMLAGMALADSLDRMSVARYIMVLLGSSALQLGLGFTARELDRSAGLAAASATTRAEAEDRLSVAEAVHAARVERYETMRPEIRAALADLSHGADPADPQVQWRCRAGAARLRRLLAETDDVPDPLLHCLRACADLAERRGVEVSLVKVGVVPEMSLPIRRALSEVPIEALSAAATWARVTVVGSGDGVVVSVVGDMPLQSIPAPDGVEITAHSEGTRRWIEARWSGGTT